MVIFDDDLCKSKDVFENVKYKKKIIKKRFYILKRKVMNGWFFVVDYYYDCY